MFETAVATSSVNGPIRASVSAGMGSGLSDAVLSDTPEPPVDDDGGAHRGLNAELLQRGRKGAGGLREIVDAAGPTGPKHQCGCGHSFQRHMHADRKHGGGLPQLATMVAFPLPS